jgi:hypothetical protein
MNMTQEPIVPNPLSDERIRQIGQRYALYYTIPGKTTRVTFNFNLHCLRDFARALEREITQKDGDTWSKVVAVGDNGHYEYEEIKGNPAEILHPRPTGALLAVAVSKSPLFEKLSDEERAECDALLDDNESWLKWLYSIENPKE